MTITFPYSSAPIRQIKEIQFGVMSPEEIVSILWPRNPQSLVARGIRGSDEGPGSLERLDATGGVGTESPDTFVA